MVQCQPLSHAYFYFRILGCHFQSFLFIFPFFQATYGQHQFHIGLDTSLITKFIQSNGLLQTNVLLRVFLSTHFIMATCYHDC